MTEQVADAQAKKEADELAALRSSVNETARVVRSNLLFLLIAGFFFGIVVAGTDDVMLLKNEDIEIPSMEIGVPVDTFYFAAPIVFFLLHLNLFLRLTRLVRITRLAYGRIGRLSLQERTFQNALFFPLDVVQAQLHRTSRGTGERRPERQPSRNILRRTSYFVKLLQYEDKQFGARVPLIVLIAVVVSVFPLSLLLWVQMRFLPFQSSYITLVHQLTFTADVILQVMFLVLAGFVRNSFSIMKQGPRADRVSHLLGWVSIPIYLCIALTFVWFVAVVPDSWNERYRPFGEQLSVTAAWLSSDWWKRGDCNRNRHDGRGLFRRYLYLKGETLSKAERPSEIIGAYIQVNEDPDKAWQFVDELDLSGRSLRYGWFESAEFWRSAFSDADLYCTRFIDAKLRGADFAGATISKANLKGAELQGADLEGARVDDSNMRSVELAGANLKYTELNGVDLREANLDGVVLERVVLRNVRLRRANLNKLDFRRAELFDVNLTGAMLRGAKFGNADLFGVDFERADLSGADFEKAKLYGVNLSRSELHGASLENAELNGVNLRRAKMHGAYLRRAKFRGANLQRTELYGANLRAARFHGVDLYRVRAHAADFRSARLRLTDVRRINTDEPREWETVIRNMRVGLKLRDVDSDEIAESLDSVRRLHRRGLRQPKAPVSDDCVWHSSGGPFGELPAPLRNCRLALEKFVVDTGCTDEDRWTAEEIVDYQRVVETDLNANTAMALLEKGPDACSGLNDDLRRDICEALVDWEEEQSGSRAIRHRWSQLKGSGVCKLDSEGN